MRVHHLAFRTPDLARLAAFYEGVLGFARAPGERDPSRGVWLRADGVILMLERAGIGEPAIDARTKELVAFAIDAGELSTWRARLADRRVAIEAETAYTIYFRDPDGRRVALSSYPL